MQIKRLPNHTFGPPYDKCANDGARKRLLLIIIVVIVLYIIIIIVLIITAT